MITNRKIVDTAVSQIGIKEPYGDDKYIEWFNQATRSSLLKSVPWCAIFVSWCFGINNASDLLKPTASCSAMVNWFKEKGQFANKESHTPNSGDIIFYDWDPEKKDGADHVGIVEAYDGDTGILDVIEGNYNDAVNRRSIYATYRYISGYGLPAYNKGDINNDGTVNTADALEVLRKAVGKPSKADLMNADMNRDGKINALDALEILKKAVGKWLK